MELCHIKSMWHSDTIVENKSGSTVLARVIAYCLTPPNHYLNQCWFLLTKSLRYTSDSNSTVPKLLSNMKSVKIIFLKVIAHLIGSNQLMVIIGGIANKKATWNFCAKRCLSVARRFHTIVFIFTRLINWCHINVCGYYVQCVMNLMI